MSKRNLFIYSHLIILLILLFIFPQKCLEAGKTSLLLWFNVIIPTLFPFIMISYMIVNSPIIDLINKLFTPVFKVTMGLSGAGSYAFLMGLISGYPMGATIINDLLVSQRINKHEAQYLLSFCNNPSPMFIIGFVASLCKNPQVGFRLLICIYIGSILTSIIFKKVYHYHYPYVTKIKLTKEYSQFSFAYFDSCITRTAEILVKVGGYIVFFSIPITLLSQLSIHHSLYTFIISLLELSNGVYLLSSSINATYLQYPLLGALCAFGSLSVVGQTASVIKASGLSIRKYFIAKCVHAAMTFLVCIAIFRFI